MGGYVLKACWLAKLARSVLTGLRERRSQLVHAGGERLRLLDDGSVLQQGLELDQHAGQTAAEARRSKSAGVVWRRVGCARLHGVVEVVDLARRLPRRGMAQTRVFHVADHPLEPGQHSGRRHGLVRVVTCGGTKTR